MTTMIGNVLRSALLISLAVSVLACSSDKAGDVASGSDRSKRISVLEGVKTSSTGAQLTDYEIRLPEPAVIRDWAQAGGNTQHTTGNPALALVPEKIWSTDIGSGSGGYYKLLATPVVSNGVVYTMDARGSVSAYKAENGDRLWRIETKPENRDDDAIGGGIAIEGEVLYATTGFGEVIAMRTYDGAIKWRQSVGKPIRSAPTIAEGRVFVIDVENESYALDASAGLVLWHYSGIAESATIMGTASPAVNGNTVVVAYSSGEVFGLRAQNGRLVWSEVLAVPTRIGALPAIADIRALPVMFNGYVYSVSHSGRMVCVQERTGERLWEADLGGMNTPAVAGNAMYLVTLDNELLALNPDSGRVIWNVQLQKLMDASDPDAGRISWWGPVLANGRLWLTNSMGGLVAYSAETGMVAYDHDLADAFYLPPIVANNMMFLLDDDGEIYAFK